MKDSTLDFLEVSEYSPIELAFYTTLIQAKGVFDNINNWLNILNIHN